jgi:Fur family transcriptional regulator, peroxide stress response regulator
VIYLQDKSENDYHYYGNLVLRKRKIVQEKLNKNARAVLETVRAAHNHPTTSEIYETVKQIQPHIGLASVYRILHSLVEQNYIKELRHGDDSCRYDGHVSRHDHAICTSCGTLLDVPINIPLTQEALETAAQAAGIELSFHELRLYGLCPACKKKQAEQALLNSTRVQANNV